MCSVAVLGVRAPPRPLLAPDPDAPPHQARGRAGADPAWLEWVVLVAGRGHAGGSARPRAHCHTTPV